MGSIIDVFIPHPKHFGLAIGRTSLRAVDVDMRGKVRVCEEVYFPQEIFELGILKKPDIFIKSLKELLSKGKFSTPFVATCFSEAHAYSREYQLPLMQEDEINEAVSWHVKELFPFPETELYFDWKLIEKTESGYKIIVMAVQKQVLDPLVDAIIKAGLKPLGFEPGASVIGQLLKLKPKQSALITEINRRGAYVTLVVGEMALFTTVINYTSGESTENYLNNIAKTIQEMVQFYKNRGLIKSDNIQVVLTGELTTQEWLNSLKQKTGMLVSVLDTYIKNPVFNKAYAMSITLVKQPLDPTSINLLPTDLQIQYTKERQNQFSKAIFTRSCVILVLSMLLSLGSFLAISLRRQAFDNRVNILRQKTKQQTGSTQSLLLLNAQARNVVQLAPLRSTPKNKLLVLQSILPAGVVITQWEYDDSKLQYTINGVAANRNELLLFKQKLEQTAEFDKVTLPLGSLESAENVRFSMTFVTI